MNVVTLVGRLTKDIELRYTQSGKAFGRFTLAVNRKMPNQDGVREADFISCVAWGKAAEILTDYTEKGSQLAVQGRIQTGSYDNQHGQKVYTTDVIVETFDFIDTKKNKQQTATYHQTESNTFDISNDDLPF